ncbi:MAG: hypothetical protein ABSA11_13720 [Candidatus Bathyarchaeia archaeon]
MSHIWLGSGNSCDTGVIQSNYVQAFRNPRGGLVFWFDGPVKGPVIVIQLKSYEM